MTYAKRLLGSLQKFEIPYHYETIPSKGTWQGNTQYKPSFIYSMLEKFPDKSIIYTDADSEFVKSPDLFSVLAEKCKTTMAVHYLDHEKHRGIKRPKELLSGTVFFPNTLSIKSQILSWKALCRSNPKIWDQKLLQDVVGLSAHPLPEDYCFIYDYKYIYPVDPVIVHYQASRVVRAEENRKARNR
jgi:phenylpropionate dioxygenase-like ring-hydroxylating dioxygenase large terminal subunit